jgi:hypothetical protein
MNSSTGFTFPSNAEVKGTLKVKGRDILAELDALNTKTRHIWTNDNATFFNNGITAVGDIVSDNIVIGKDLHVRGICGVKDINTKTLTLEDKCKYITSDDKFTIFNKHIYLPDGDVNIKCGHYIYWDTMKLGCNNVDSPLAAWGGNAGDGRPIQFG